VSADNINPYEPPKAACLSAHTPDPILKRPKSVKWALVIQILTLIAMPFAYFRAFQEYGSLVFTESPWGTILDVAALITCFPLLLGIRRPWVHWVTVVFLALKLKDTAMTLLGHNPAFDYDDIAALVTIYVIGGLMVFLFYRFTFGRPSREYFERRS